MPLKIGQKELTKEQTIFLGIVVAIVLALILVMAGVLPGRRDTVQEIDIDVWVLDEDTKVWKTSVNRFGSSYPNVNVNVTEIDPKLYESELVNALAAGRGPDVFMFNSKWLVEHGDKVTPAPAEKITVESFRGIFPQVAEQDFISEERIHAMPLTMDTLALVYNRDIFDRKGVVLPPRTWTEFDAAVTAITSFENGVLRDKASAIGGTSKSIPNAADILSLLMLQNGSQIVHPNYTRTSFGREAEDALEAYTKYSDSLNPLYTWSDSLGNANDVFAGEGLAMLFAYPSDIKEIQDDNPSIDFEIAKVPQVDLVNPVNFANYWGLTVSRFSENPETAWDFAIFATTDSRSAEEHASETGHAPALRFLISEYSNHPDLGVFAEQALTAKSWLQPEDDAVEALFDKMIDNVVKGELSVNAAIYSGRSGLTELIRR